jgi:hypothetical protein
MSNKRSSSRLNNEAYKMGGENIIIGQKEKRWEFT